MTEKSAREALRLEIEGCFARIGALVDARQEAFRLGRSDQEDIAKAKLIEDFVELQQRLDVLPEAERSVAQHRLSALQLRF